MLVSDLKLPQYHTTLILGRVAIRLVIYSNSMPNFISCQTLGSSSFKCKLPSNRIIQTEGSMLLDIELTSVRYMLGNLASYYLVGSSFVLVE